MRAVVRNIFKAKCTSNKDFVFCVVIICNFFQIQLFAAFHERDSTKQLSTLNFFVNENVNYLYFKFATQPTY